ncbi:hypothetical protein MJN51_39075, partial [Salmonella enterica subsp. enterica serovar Kentucky]|nr:hypothetical protein [Salmonella enterica subsp. enterica serovar Kentucky]
VLLAACTNDGGQQQTTVAPQPAVCNGPTVEISGAEPRYEPLNRTMKDGWTVKTKDRSLSAQYEHTIVVTENGCEILTLRKDDTI